MKDTLVVYYSLSGNTRELASRIADGADADLLELKPLKDPPPGFLKYVFGGFGALRGKKAELRPLGKDPSRYRNIFVGTPVWAGSPAPPVNTLLTDHLPHDGSKLAFFVSCDGGEGRVFEKMRARTNGNRIVSEKSFLSSKKKSNDGKKILKDAFDWARSTRADMR